METNPKMKPCPFCGGTSIEIRSNGIGDFFAICYGEDDEMWCGASTSDMRCESREHAVERWNTRAPRDRKEPSPNV